MSLTTGTTATNGGLASLTNAIATTLGASTVGGALDSGRQHRQSDPVGCALDQWRIDLHDLGGDGDDHADPGQPADRRGVAQHQRRGQQCQPDEQSGDGACGFDGGRQLTIVDSIGNLTQTGVQTVTGASSFTTSASGATITLGSTNLLTGAVSLSTNGAGANASLTNGTTTSLGASSTGGNLTIVSDSLSVSGSVNASGQTVAIQPRTASTAMSLSGASALNLSQASLNNITAATLSLGGATATGAITVGASTSLPSTITNLQLTTNAAATAITIGNSLTDSNANGSITLQANSVSIGAALTTNSGNGTVRVQPNTAATTLSLAGASALNLTQAAINNITAKSLVLGSATATGALTTGGTVSMPSTVTNLQLETNAAATAITTARRYGTATPMGRSRFRATASA